MIINFDQFFEAPTPPKEKQLAELTSVLLHLGERRVPKASCLLSGGYRNHNYLITFVSQFSQPVVLRIASDILEARKEATLLKTYQKDLPLPQVLGERETFIHYFTLLSYCSGEVASQIALDMSDSAWEAIGACIGKTLAQIHQVSFPQAGFLGPDLQIAIPFEDQGIFWWQTLMQILETQSSGVKLGGALRQKMVDFLWARQAEFAAIPAQAVLVHSDFNLKNLILQQAEGGWQVKAVLDWEFAHVGSPLGDLGNFLRFETYLPPQLCQGFIMGYQTLAGPLPVDWRAWAYLLDLTALGTMLERAEPGSRTLNTIQNCFQKTLQFFES